MTGSPFYTRQMNAVALSDDRWQIRLVDSISVPSRWRHTPSVLTGLLRADVWYSCGGATSWKAALIASAALHLRIPTVMHWIGSDVLEARDYFRRRQSFRRHIADRFEHWATAPWLADELRDLGIEASVMPLTSLKRKAYLSMPIPSLPNQFTLLTSIDPTRPEFYGWPHVVRLAKDFPDITVHVLRATADQLPDTPPNVHFLGWLEDTFEAYQHCTVAVRMTVHDGYSASVQEPLALGRYAIWTYPFPGSLPARDYPTLHAHVSDLLQRHRRGVLAPNHAGRAFIAEHLDPGVLAKKFEDRLRARLSAASLH